MPHRCSTCDAGHWLEAEGDQVGRGGEHRIAPNLAANGWLVPSHLANSCMVLDCQVYSSLGGRWTWARQADHTLWDARGRSLVVSPRK